MIKIFIGCSANHEDAESQAVIEWTLNKFASEPFEIIWMKLSKDPDSRFYSDGKKGWQTQEWATPFSGFRWGIPHWCDYKGKAIYMDSDMINRVDISELWKQEIAGLARAKGGAHSWRYCVSLWDCEAMKGISLPYDQMIADRYHNRQMTAIMRANHSRVQLFEGNWNCLDGETYEDLSDPDIKIIHYTSMKHQPQLRHAVPRLAKDGREHWFGAAPALHWRKDLLAMFDAELVEAEANGYPVSRYLQDPLFGAYDKKDSSGQGRVIPPWAGKHKAGEASVPAL